MPAFPIIDEMWQAFQTTLQVQARRLVNDIAKETNTDPKELWRLVGATIKTPLVSADLPDPLPSSCPALLNRTEGAIRLRCRAPCLLGFQTCSAHTRQFPEPQSSEPCARRYIDSEKGTFFISEDIVYDVNGQPQGFVKDGDVFFCCCEAGAGAAGEAGAGAGAGAGAAGEATA